MKTYLAIVGISALVLGSIGSNRRTGNAERDWAAGLLALEAWRWFWWIAFSGAVLGTLREIALYFGWVVL